MANLKKALIGSEPDERTNTRGVVFEVSSYKVDNLTGGLSTNCGPRLSDTKSNTAKRTYGHTRNLLVQT